MNNSSSTDSSDFLFERGIAATYSSECKTPQTEKRKTRFKKLNQSIPNKRQFNQINESKKKLLRSGDDEEIVPLEDRNLFLDENDLPDVTSSSESGEEVIMGLDQNYKGKSISSPNLLGSPQIMPEGSPNRNGKANPRLAKLRKAVISPSPPPNIILDDKKAPTRATVTHQPFCCAIPIPKTPETSKRTMKIKSNNIEQKNMECYSKNPVIRTNSKQELKPKDIFINKKFVCTKDKVITLKGVRTQYKVFKDSEALFAVKMVGGLSNRELSVSKGPEAHLSDSPVAVIIVANGMTDYSLRDLKRNELVTIRTACKINQEKIYKIFFSESGVIHELHGKPVSGGAEVTEFVDHFKRAWIRVACYSNIACEISCTECFDAIQCLAIAIAFFGSS